MTFKSTAKFDDSFILEDMAPPSSSVFHRMSEVMENASDLIQSCDTEGNFLFVNNSWKKTLGYSHEELKTLNVFDIIDPSSKAHCQEIVEKIAVQKIFKDEKVSLLTKNGRKVFTRANINAQFDTDGNLRGTQAIFRDITETKLAKDKVKEAEIKYQILVESANDVIYQGDQDGFLLFTNKLAEELTGYSTTELEGIHFQQLVHDDYTRRVSLFYSKQVRDRVDSTYLEFPVKRKDGDSRWVGQTIRLLTERKTKKITGFMGVMRDITDKRKIEIQLKDSKRVLERRVQERTSELLEANDRLRVEIEGRRKVERFLHETKQEYEQLFQNAHDAIIIFEPEKENVLEVNLRACKLYGIERNDFVGMSLEKISTNVPKRKELIKKTISRQNYSHFEIGQITPGGKKIVLEINALPVTYKGKDAILSINRDITKRFELDKQLEQERRQRITSLIDGQEIEKRRFARELHDSLGQMLTATVHHLRSLKKQGELNEKQKITLAETELLSQKVIEETRRISKNLMPAVLEDFGLFSALQNLVDSIGESIPSITFVGKDTLRLRIEDEIALYRIAQEALNNAIKHANAKTITIQLSDDSNETVLSVTDNGEGFDVNLIDIGKGNGLSNMRQRAEIIGAKFELLSSAKNGTEIKVSLKK